MEIVDTDVIQTILSRLGNEPRTATAAEEIEEWKDECRRLGDELDEMSAYAQNLVHQKAAALMQVDGLERENWYLKKKLAECMNKHEEEHAEKEEEEDSEEEQRKERELLKKNPKALAAMRKQGAVRY